MKRREFTRHRAFTLIELLVVVAIIALLISILLPALSGARRSSWMTVSLNNLHQQGIAMGAYRESNKSQVPFGLCYVRGMAPFTPGEPSLGFCGWSYGGKNNWPWWSGREFDVEADDRPLNPYLYPDVVDWGAPPPPDRMAQSAPGRAMEAKVFRDPSDSVSYQRQWPLPTKNVSSYNDVGTSYHFNTKWWGQVRERFGDGEAAYVRAFESGLKRLSLSDAFNPAKFVWLNDQSADVVTQDATATYQVMNGYRDINKSLMCFFDSHAAYLPVIPGGGKDAFCNSRYSLVFEELPIPIISH